MTIDLFTENGKLFYKITNTYEDEYGNIYEEIFPKVDGNFNPSFLYGIKRLLDRVCIEHDTFDCSCYGLHKVPNYYFMDECGNKIVIHRTNYEGYKDTCMLERKVEQHYTLTFKEYQALKSSLNSVYGLTGVPRAPKIKDVIYNDPATIIFWTDETKTVVKSNGTEAYDPEKGLAMGICKKLLGTNKSQSNYYDIFKQLLPKEVEE